MKLPYLTAEVPPVPGAIRTEAQDFQVEEVPAYEPSGDGTHLFLWVEKVDLTTPEAVKRLARVLEVDPRSAGFAGLKDRRAITRQWLSFEGAPREAAVGLELPGLRVLEAHYHPSKLRTGHLRGNRFRVRVRRTDPARIHDARRVFERLVAEGVPNYFGEQRFGAAGDNVTRARAWIVEGGPPPRAAFERKFLASALQAELFNRRVAARVAGEGLARVFPGDLVRKEDTGGLFTVEDVAEAQERSDRWALSPTGPMFGPKMRWPKDVAEAQELALLREAGLDETCLRRIGRAGEGTRRPVRFRLTNPRLEETQDGFEVAFELPPGAYATVVLREILKGDAELAQKR